VTDPRGRSWELGPIPAGGRRRRFIAAKGEGAILFTANVNGTVTQGVVDGYFTSGMGGKDWSVTLNPNGSFVVQ
jgi:hypothetical protein